MLVHMVAAQPARVMGRDYLRRFRWRIGISLDPATWAKPADLLLPDVVCHERKPFVPPHAARDSPQQSPDVIKFDPAAGKRVCHRVDGRDELPDYDSGYMSLNVAGGPHEHGENHCRGKGQDRTRGDDSAQAPHPRNECMAAMTSPATFIPCLWTAARAS